MVGGGKEEGVADRLARGREHLYERRLERGELEGFRQDSARARASWYNQPWLGPYGTRTEMGGWGLDRSCSELYTSSFVWLGESRVRHRRHISVRTPSISNYPIPVYL